MHPEAAPLEVPAQVWALPEMGAACERQDFAAILRLARKHTGASYNLISRCTGIAPTEISAVINGKQRVEKFNRIVAIAAGLGMPDDARLHCGLAPAQTAAEERPPGRGATTVARAGAGSNRQARCTCPTVAQSAADDGGECAVHRRRFLSAAGSTLALAALPVGHSTAAAPIQPTASLSAGQLGVDHVRRIERSLLQIYAADDEFGGEALLGLAYGHLRRVRWWLRSGEYSEQLGQRLRSAAGRVAASAGWLAFDAGRHPEAREFYHEALAHARISGDEPLTVLALASMSLQSTYLGAAHEALDFARAAQSSPAAQESITASVLAVREARALARLNDSSASVKAMARARAALDRAGPPPEHASWASFQDHAELTANEGLCRADLGDHPGARRLLRQALDAQAPTYTRNRALYGIRLADSALTLGELEEACALATTAVSLASHVDSRRVLDHIRDFRRRTSRHHDNEAAREFNERCELILSGREIA
jgi:tetratricopeptide (TPR) repeat protein/transcriptional regulator with XRE-family HTH domain